MAKNTTTTIDPSGPHWIARFPGSKATSRCVPAFRTGLDAFLATLAAAGAAVRINATSRPPERAYLMHWAWKIAKNLVEPQNVPAMNGVAIDWLHRDEQGFPDLPKSRSAAMQMVSAFGIVAQPALVSRHTQGRAIDMNISWQDNLQVVDALGKTRTNKTEPRTGLNPELHRVGASFGVIKAAFDDPPHWSDDGH